MRAVVVARASIAAHVRSALFSVLSDIGTRISVARSALSASVSRQAQPSRPPEVVQHEVSVSLGIVGHNGWGTRDKTSLDLAILC